MTIAKARGRGLSKISNNREVLKVLIFFQIKIRYTVFEILVTKLTLKNQLLEQDKPKQ